jgi:hypothetical protein
MMLFIELVILLLMSGLCYYQLPLEIVHVKASPNEPLLKLTGTTQLRPNVSGNVNETVSINERHY